MIRIVIVLAVILGILAVAWFFKAPPELLKKRLKQVAWIVAALLLIVLMISGRLSGLLALLGVLFAFLLRSMPVIFKYAPQIHSIWQRFRASAPRDQPGSRPNVGPSMTRVQALDVLGLKPDATEEQIVQAHRKLISRLHPDRGGSDYLAAQINQAKKILLGR